MSDLALVLLVTLGLSLGSAAAYLTGRYTPSGPDDPLLAAQAEMMAIEGFPKWAAWMNFPSDGAACYYATRHTEEVICGIRFLNENPDAEPADLYRHQYHAGYPITRTQRFFRGKDPVGFKAIRASERRARRAGTADDEMLYLD